MTDLRTAAQQALEALAVATNCLDGYYIPRGKTTLPEIEDAIAALRAALAEPQEPDSPERRCGGPGCDGTCCQPVQEPKPVAWLYRGNLHPFDPSDGASDPATPLYAHPPQRPAEPVQEPVASIYITPEGEREFDDWRCDLPVGRTELYAVPPQRKPLTEEEIYGMYSEPSSDAEMVEFARAVERAHGIGGEG